LSFCSFSFREHTNAELLDLYGLVSNTFQIIIADGNVSGRELTRLVADCHQLYTALKNAYNKTTEIVLDSNLLERLDIESWHKAIGEFKCGIPSNENIQGWLEAMDSWFYGISTPLNALGNIALELLLEEESEIRKNYHEQTPLTPRPGPSTMPSQYTTLIEGEERALQRKLNWWDSFQTATGVIPSTLRFLISCSIVVSVLFASIYYK